jgi:hypothetical protein
MSRLGKDYYTHNLLSEIAALQRRLAALERRPVAAEMSFTTQDTTTTVGRVGPLYLVDEATGDVYQLVARTIDGVPRLLLHLAVKEGGS